MDATQVYKSQETCVTIGPVLGMLQESFYYGLMDWVREWQVERQVNCYVSVFSHDLFSARSGRQRSVSRKIRSQTSFLLCIPVHIGILLPS